MEASEKGKTIGDLGKSGQKHPNKAVQEWNEKKFETNTLPFPNTGFQVNRLSLQYQKTLGTLLLVDSDNQFFKTKGNPYNFKINHWSTDIQQLIDDLGINKVYHKIQSEATLLKFARRNRINAGRIQQQKNAVKDFLFAFNSYLKTIQKYSTKRSELNDEVRKMNEKSKFENNPNLNENYNFYDKSEVKDVVEIDETKYLLKHKEQKEIN
ncbi:MAG: hypothetical protein N4A49_08210 [Marinifilaceae bacterium]|jgi:hypothetical protein|nr:hypothetical protein [Marinifilaceae bacterium]